MGGVLGVDWRRWTHFDLCEAYRARVEHDYEMSSRLEWAAYQFSGYAKKDLQPKDFNPLKKKAGARGVPVDREVLHAMKHVYKNETVKASDVKVRKRKP